MANQTAMTAVCQCSFGTTPATLLVSSQSSVMALKQPAATVMDNQFPTFGMCSNPANPAVASATAAALGVLTPAPCVPACSAPWAPGCPTVMICGKPALSSTSTLMCSYPGGVIAIKQPIASTVNIP